MADEIRDTTREPYEPPTVEDVPLFSEEQVLAGCKTTNGPNPGRGGLPHCVPCRLSSVS
jgi:hypothetical protein